MQEKPPLKVNFASHLDPNKRENKIQSTFNSKRNDILYIWYIPSNRASGKTLPNISLFYLFSNSEHADYMIQFIKQHLCSLTQIQ